MKENPKSCLRLKDLSITDEYQITGMNPPFDTPVQNSNTSFLSPGKAVEDHFCAALRNGLGTCLEQPVGVAMETLKRCMNTFTLYHERLGDQHCTNCCMESREGSSGADNSCTVYRESREAIDRYYGPSDTTALSHSSHTVGAFGSVSASNQSSRSNTYNHRNKSSVISQSGMVTRAPTSSLGRDVISATAESSTAQNTRNVANEGASNSKATGSMFNTSSDANGTAGSCTRCLSPGRTARTAKLVSPRLHSTTAGIASCSGNNTEPLVCESHENTSKAHTDTAHAESDSGCAMPVAVPADCTLTATETKQPPRKRGQPAKPAHDTATDTPSGTNTTTMAGASPETNGVAGQRANEALNPGTAPDQMKRDSHTTLWGSCRKYTPAGSGYETDTVDDTAHTALSENNTHDEKAVQRVPRNKRKCTELSQTREDGSGSGSSDVGSDSSDTWKPTSYYERQTKTASLNGLGGVSGRSKGQSGRARSVPDSTSTGTRETDTGASATVKPESGVLELERMPEQGVVWSTVELVGSAGTMEAKHYDKAECAGDIVVRDGQSVGIPEKRQGVAFYTITKDAHHKRIHS
ncbi:hypothetical protein SARC_09479 [Sphaeroforma arctica JP610]|uniref:Uncharacterized protein n=1 Tax=Sphaeroforma arctica JP610 TaxID=667725 RepID=A0A0L0FNR5_9EUKA|nr:hypothetical protein SARC_09479 [Sphaeroforma arctica JP610]KNC78071.1 hypothetical protein SARC_09479 [Sphaeroforma arctica JP610]|eukprot:XP_014151973.1 hypothetical protein SARC_09479 [Sphaeroforma arctica JP610]